MRIISFCKKHAHVASGILIMLVLSLAYSWFAGLDYSLYDAWMRLRGAGEPGKEIVIVAVDDPSIQALGKKWPWSRKVFAELLRKVHLQGPRAVALDFLFTEAGDPDEDQAFREAIDLYRGKTALVSALHLYQEASREGALGEDAVYTLQRKAELPVFEGLNSGFINISQDGDGVLRRTVLSRSFEGRLYHSLAFETYRLLDKSNLQNWYARNPELSRSYLLGFRGPDKTFPRLSAVSLLKGDSGPALKDKIVLIGPVFKASKDFHATPFDHYGSMRSRMAGVEIHATILGNLLEGDFYRQASNWSTWLSFLILGGLAFFLTLSNWSAGKQLAVFCSVWCFGVFLSLGSFLFARVYVPPAFPMLGGLILFGTMLIAQKITARQGFRVEMGQLGPHGIEMLDIFCGRYGITRREKELLPLLARQLSNPELSAKLFVSINTVKTHVASIYKKTGVSSREELAEMLSGLQKPVST